MALTPQRRPRTTYRGYTDRERPTWKLRALLLGVMDARMERELDRLDRFLTRLAKIHIDCNGVHQEVRRWPA